MEKVHTGIEVLLEDQALRDGLQMESRIFSIEEKLRLFEMLSASGIPRIQVGSFVHPRVVPQMADTDTLVRRIGNHPETVVSALILNERGLDRALACGVQHASLSVSVSDTHSRKNTRKPADQALVAMAGLLERALDSGLDARAGLQCVFGCVYEGKIAEKRVLSAAVFLAKTGVREISLADTTGMATPRAIEKVVTLLRKELPQLEISLHLHDTRGLGLANLMSGFNTGVRSFDACAGGLGGCPFVKGAAGNVPMEDTVHLFEAMGIATGVDLAGVCEAVDYLEGILGRRLPGHMNRVLKTRSVTACGPYGRTDQPEAPL